MISIIARWLWRPTVYRVFVAFATPSDARYRITRHQGRAGGAQGDSAPHKVNDAGAMAFGLLDDGELQQVQGIIAKFEEDQAK